MIASVALYASQDLASFVIVSDHMFISYPMRPGDFAATQGRDQCLY